MKKGKLIFFINRSFGFFMESKKSKYKNIMECHSVRKTPAKAALVCCCDQWLVTRRYRAILFWNCVFIGRWDGVFLVFLLHLGDVEANFTEIFFREWAFVKEHGAFEIFAKDKIFDLIAGERKFRDGMDETLKLWLPVSFVVWEYFYNEFFYVSVNSAKL